MAVSAFVTPRVLRSWVFDARQKTLDIVSDLNDQDLLGPKLDIVNPLLWEIGHVAWFQEKWVLRHALGRPPVRSDADRLWDSMAIAHDTRWDLALPSRGETIRYVTDVRDAVLEALDAPSPPQELLFHSAYSVFHEDMHTEAFTYTRQTHGFSAPHLGPDDGAAEAALGSHSTKGEDLIPSIVSSPKPVSSPSDVSLPGVKFSLGAERDAAFVLDNEKWAHPVELAPFAIAAAPVTQAEFQAFVDDDGYERQNLWGEAGWSWRSREAVSHPLYWEREGRGSWYRHHFDTLVPLEPDLPVIHVNWFEATAYCRWANRRLPSEAEWEAAASLPLGEHRAADSKRMFPWGDDAPTPANSNMDWRGMGCVPVGAFPAGDTAPGCRQMIGNVWEWTASDFQPYPGFVADPYADYSEPWFGTRKVLRGGCWATRSRLIRNTWRNFYTPDRRDVFAGFRTCAPL